ncbi:unnamed protein product [Ectocarpus sp. 6 AP-2014]
MRSTYTVLCIEADKRGRFLSTLGTLCRILGLPTAVCVGFSLDKKAFAAKLPDHSGDDAENDEKKAKINAAWNNSAETYVTNILDGDGITKDSSDSSESGPAAVTPAMSVGHKAAARVAVDRANEVQRKESGAPVVLDVASAGGEPAITIAKAVPGATIYATDFAPAMMDLIRRRAAEAGVSNVKEAVADGEALTEFGDGSVDAVTCTFGLFFMPNWQRAVQEFSRVLKTDGVVAMTIFEKHDDSTIRCLNRVLGTLIPGHVAVIDLEALGDDEASGLVEEMKGAGLCNVTVTKFSVPVFLSPEARPGDIWEYWVGASTLGQAMESLEAQGRTNVRQEAREIFEGQMEKDWAAGRTPLGLQKSIDGSMHSVSSAAPESPHAYGMKALLITGRKHVG